MTPREREAAFRRAQLDMLKLRTSIQRNTATELSRFLKDAQEEIARMLATQPSDYQRWRLADLRQNIQSVLVQFQRQGGKIIADAANKSFAAGQSIVDEPIAAGGVQISRVLPHLETRQLSAMRAFMVDKIADISSEAMGKIAGQLGMVTIGGISPGEAVSQIATIIDGGRERAFNLVRTEVGRAFSTATQERAQQASERLPGLQKQWRRSGKVYSRTNHDIIDGQIRDVNEPFTLGNGIEIMFPRAPDAPIGETINCGCESLPYMSSWKVTNPSRMPFTDDELRRNAMKANLNSGRAA